NFIVFDTKDFYPSVRQNKEVRNLIGLPQAIIDKVIFTSPKAPIHFVGGLPKAISIELFDGAARRGLPLGSPTSLLVADILYGRTLASVAPVDRTIFYGDDGLIAVSNSKEAAAIKTALSEAF